MSAIQGGALSFGDSRVASGMIAKSSTLTIRPRVRTDLAMFVASVNGVLGVAAPVAGIGLVRRSRPVAG